MNVVRDRREARWLPSRFRFALFRLFASLRYRFAKPQPERGLMLMIDRDQSAIEIYSVAIWLTLTLIAYLAHEVGIVIAILIAGIVIHLPMYTIGALLGLVWKTNGRRINSVVYMLVFILAAVYYARVTSWVRYVAWLFLALVALNAIVASVLSRRRAILAFAAIAPVALVLLWPYSWIGAIGVLFVSHMLVLYPTLRPNAQWLGPVITRFETDRKEAWLTIDDGPADDTRALLAVLDQRNVRATFFVKGTLVDARPELAREILARGHTIANHSQTHPSGTFWCLPPGRIEREIDEANRAIERITGSRPRWFRAPVGMKNPFVHPLLEERGMQLIGWTARGFDAVEHDTNKIAARIVADLAPGAIIVMHQGCEWSVRTLAHVIDAVRERGYEFVMPDADLLTSGR